MELGDPMESCRRQRRGRTLGYHAVIRLRTFTVTAAVKRISPSDDCPTNKTLTIHPVTSCNGAW